MIKVDKDAKRKVILEAASRVFAKKGFFTARISDIARECNMADGTLYLYFDGKDNILVNLFEEKMEYFLERFKKAISGESDPKEQLRKLVYEQFKLAEEFPDFAEVVTVELRQSAKFMKEYKNEKFFEYLKIIQEILERGKALDIVDKSIDSFVSARGIFGIMDELILMWVLSRGKTDLKHLADCAWRIISKGIFNS